MREVTAVPDEPEATADEWPELTALTQSNREVRERLDRILDALEADEREDVREAAQEITPPEPSKTEEQPRPHRRLYPRRRNRGGS